jgi:hypothetical protein
VSRNGGKYEDWNTVLWDIPAEGLRSRN